jgi:SnoaL-like protein
MDLIERLAAIEQIKRLKARYFRCLDTKDWNAFADVFAGDAVLDVSDEVATSDDPDAGVVRGNQELARYVRSHVDEVVTVHHGHMPEIDLVTPTTATGIWAMEDKLRWPPGAPIAAMHGYGHYHETYVKVDGQWRIASLKLTRLRLDFEPGDR